MSLSCPWRLEDNDMSEEVLFFFWNPGYSQPKRSINMAHQNNPQWPRREFVAGCRVCHYLGQWKHRLTFVQEFQPYSGVSPISKMKTLHHKAH